MKEFSIPVRNRLLRFLQNMPKFMSNSTAKLVDAKELDENNLMACVGFFDAENVANVFRVYYLHSEDGFKTQSPDYTDKSCFDGSVIPDRIGTCQFCTDEKERGSIELERIEVSKEFFKTGRASAIFEYVKELAQTNLCISGGNYISKIIGRVSPYGSAPHFAAINFWLKMGASEDVMKHGNLLIELQERTEENA